MHMLVIPDLYSFSENKILNDPQHGAQTKRPADKTSYDKTSDGQDILRTKHPTGQTVYTGQNVQQTKYPAGQNVVRVVLHTKFSFAHRRFRIFTNEIISEFSL